MICFFDTSALIKNYIEESGTVNVASLLDRADEIFVSEICIIESISTIRRIFEENKITRKEYEILKEEIKKDHRYFSRINIESVYDIAEGLIDKYQLKSLDSIQLGSMLSMKNRIDFFVCCDKKLLEAAAKEKIKTINPIRESAN